jgi:octanoyl-[GcvH]:protein N-octanoyltransferase
MLLVRGAPAASAALEIALSHALLLRVSRGELPSLMRLYRPEPTVAFGKLDTLRPGYPAASELARSHGYEPVLRLPGGHAAAYHRQSLGLDLVWSVADPVPGTHDRFRETGERLAGALAELGVDARVGEVPGEYCPGAYSVNARGRVKLIGTAQRLVRGAALLGAVIVVRDGAHVREVLRGVYERLELEWDEATAGSVAEEVPGVGVVDVERAVLAAYPDLEYVRMDAETLALAEELAPQHRLAQSGAPSGPSSGSSDSAQ